MKKVFDKEELDTMSKFELMHERTNTEREIQKQIRMLENFGSQDKYNQERNRHISLLYEKRHYIEKRLKEFKKK